MKYLNYLAFILLPILVLVLVACGPDQSAGQQEPANAGGANAEPVAEQMPAGDPAAGKEIFTATCSACHGSAGEGVTGLGKDMTGSAFIGEISDAELVEFIKVGRDPSDPLNSTGVAMPARGGNPALSDQDLLNVVAFVRSLQK
ncbi:MAG: cytochrome c [Anaerolineae bacterium]|nr:cytochrome c [Anaerolineae bacterium]